MYQFTAVTGNSSFLKDDKADRTQVSQRFRTQIDMIAFESLKGVLFLEIGHIFWGKGADPSFGNNGGALGADGTNVKTRYMYVDWVIPQTEVQVRMGLQNFALPSYTDIGAAVLGADVADGAGITVSGQFTENVGLPSSGCVLKMTTPLLMPITVTMVIISATPWILLA